VTEQVPVKSAAADAGINLNSASRFKKQWEEENTVLPSKKKREPDKGVMINMKQQHTQFAVAILDSYAPMILDRIRHIVLVEFPNLAVSKTAFFNHVR
jgi:hypothetical protein